MNLADLPEKLPHIVVTLYHRTDTTRTTYVLRNQELLRPQHAKEMEAWCRTQQAARRGLHLRTMQKAAGFQDTLDAAERQQEQLHQNDQDNTRVHHEAQRDGDDMAMVTSRSRLTLLDAPAKESRRKALPKAREAQPKQAAKTAPVPPVLVIAQQKRAESPEQGSVCGQPAPLHAGTPRSKRAPSVAGSAITSFSAIKGRGRYEVKPLSIESVLSGYAPGRELDGAALARAHARARALGPLPRPARSATFFPPRCTPGQRPQAGRG